MTTVYDVGRLSESNMETVAALAAKGPMPLRVLHTLHYSATDTATAAAAINTIKSVPAINPVSGILFFRALRPQQTASLGANARKMMHKVHTSPNRSARTVGPAH